MKQLLLLCSLVLFSQSGGQPINVPIQNPSFEQAPTRAFNQDPCGPWIWEVPGWTIIPLQTYYSAGIFRPTEPSPASNPNCLGGVSPAPDGITVAYLAGASISQNLGPAPGNDGIYTMTIYFGDRYYYYSSWYSASLKFGDEQFCAVSGEARGDFTQIPVVCPIAKNPTPKDLIITLTATGNFTLLTDKVSLTFTPTN